MLWYLLKNYTLSLPIALFRYGFYWLMRIFMQCISYKTMFNLHRIYYWLLMKFSYQEKYFIQQGKHNIRNFVGGYTKKQAYLVAYSSAQLISLEQLRSQLYPYIRARSYEDMLNRVKLNSPSSIKNINAIAQQRKVIFCHSHSADRIAGVDTMIESMDSSIRHLFIHRAFSARLLASCANNAQQKNYTVDQLDILAPDYNKQFLIKFRLADCIHVFADLPLADAMRNFTYAKVNFFGYQAIFLTGVIRIALLGHGIIVPVYVTGDYDFTLHTGAIIDTQVVTSKNKTEVISLLTQQLAAEYECLAKKFPLYWTGWHRLEKFYTRANYLA